ncbi:MAG TPA: hypothetical protein VET24_00335 [Actinomycetota bacterium]|nr:hypothetical protein [Actinomycetota bacterium]
MSGAPDLVEVRILSMPVPVLQRAREHGDALMREFTLIRLSESDHHGVPTRLLELADELKERFSGFTAGTDAELAAAEASSAAEVSRPRPRRPASASRPSWTRQTTTAGPASTS